MPSTKRPLGVLIAVLGVMFAAVALAGPASAYPITPASSGVSTGAPKAGASFTVSGANFAPGESVTIRLTGGALLGTATADSSGAFSDFSVALACGVTTGSHTIDFTGVTSGETSTETIMVGAAPANCGTVAFTGPGSTTTGSTTTGGTLAFTGAAVIAIGSLALLLVVGGGFMMLAGRRRKGVV